MFPFLVTDPQGTLSIDDIAWISKLYPAAAAGLRGDARTITGTVFFSDGESHAQLVNVVARRVDNGGRRPDESRTTAASGVSGNRSASSTATRSTSRMTSRSAPSGSQDGNRHRLLRDPVPPGNYTIEVETIDPEFTEGSSVGGEDHIDMPGTAPPPLGPITVTATQPRPRSDRGPAAPCPACR